MEEVAVWAEEARETEDAHAAVCEGCAPEIDRKRRLEVTLEKKRPG